MKIDIAPDFPLPGFWSRRAVAEVVYEFDGRRYYLRQLDQHILYRMADQNSLEHTLFVPCRSSGRNARPVDHIRERISIHRPDESRSWNYPEAVFAQQLQNGENGRFALYTCPLARDSVATLFFHTNGTGFFLDYHTANGYSAHEPTERIDFRWLAQAHFVPTLGDILRAAPEQMKALCEKVFTRQVWPHMKDPFIAYAALPDEPFAFTCGSERELEHVTRCICHTDPDLFESNVNDSSETGRLFSFCYRAVSSKNMDGLGKEGRANRRLEALGALAFQHNTFTGGKWEYGRYRENKRKASYKFVRAEINFHIAPPSAHERAEAFLFLWDWLDGKVTEAEKQRFLPLD